MSTDTPARGTNPVVAFLQRRWLSVLLVVLALVFVVQNRHEVRINLLATTVTTPLWVALTAMLVVGLAAGTFRIRRASRRDR
ncbi:LapA family protein [Cellulomonas triticagri]|uniref:LapA family protein n=1 Tax=Cellulomonas triticagri TaxID=2483352 RepID=A0A3M2IV90_9CELL|nr:LapA family protein [Cellulomonas triticagri]RMI05039.1 LapA family protein [Cellulomonas triticagri]